MSYSAHALIHPSAVGCCPSPSGGGREDMVASGGRRGWTTQPELSACPQLGVTYGHRRPCQHPTRGLSPQCHLATLLCSRLPPRHALTCCSPWLLAARSSCRATGSPASAEPAAAWGFAQAGAGVTSGGCWG